MHWLVFRGSKQAPMASCFRDSVLKHVYQTMAGHVTKHS